MSEVTAKEHYSTIPPERRSVNEKSFFQRLWKQIDIQLMVWPGVVLIFIFAYIPISRD